MVWEGGTTGLQQINELTLLHTLTVHTIIVRHTIQKFLPLAKILSTNYFSCVNVCIEDVATFTIIIHKNLNSAKYFCNAKVAGLGEIILPLSFWFNSIQCQANTLSIALELSFMMEAWASLSNTSRSDFLVSTFWGRKISFTQRESNIWPTISLITGNNEVNTVWAQLNHTYINYYVLKLHVHIGLAHSLWSKWANLFLTWPCSLSELWVSGRVCRAFLHQGWRTKLEGSTETWLS